MQRTTSMSFKLINVTHRHCIFTIDENLRDFFLHDRSLLDRLFHAVNTALLNAIECKIGPSFKKGKVLCYKEHKEGFYVYAKPNKCDPNIVVKYIGRYLVHPVIATSRINKYDGDFVTFHYNRHEDEQYVEETISVMEFIERLIRHIPEKHYKMIQYGGIYARHRTLNKKTPLRYLS